MINDNDIIYFISKRDSHLSSKIKNYSFKEFLGNLTFYYMVHIYISSYILHT